MCVCSSVCLRACLCVCARACVSTCVFVCVRACVCVCAATAACVCVLLLHAPHTVCTPACIACSSFYYLADTNVHAHARTIMCVPRSQGELQMNSTALDELKQQVQYIRRVRARGVCVRAWMCRCVCVIVCVFCALSVCVCCRCCCCRYGVCMCAALGGVA